MSATAYGPDLSLNRNQEELLRTALSSNPKASPKGSSNMTNAAAQQSPIVNGSMENGTNIYTSPVEDVPGSATLGSFDESPYLDYELDDGNFDWDNNGDQLFGDLPGGDNNDDGEQHDKRKASLEDDDEDASNKRREGGEKSAKKPGRKPLQGEPTTKRKAQNRAAQRAFRERKERHLKDLEIKVDDLEKASEATNHENGRLRAHVEKLNVELKEYRKRLSMNSIGGSSPPLANPQTRNFNNSNDFQFAFPKFGDLPSSFMNNGSMAKTSSSNQIGQQPSASSSNPNLPGMTSRESSASINTKSPTNPSRTFDLPSASSLENGNAISNKTNSNATNLEDLSGLFSPSILETASRSNSMDYLSFTNGKGTSPSVSNTSVNNNANGQTQKPQIQQRNSSTSMTASPLSAMSPNGLDSSCGTTPESSADSPDKPGEGTLNTINEETSTQTGPEGSTNAFKEPGSDINGIDWMAQQNGGTFDPVLFGDYRDPQDNILNNSFGDFFNDAFEPPIDFSSPYNTGELTSPFQPQKRNLMDEIEVQQNGGPEAEEFVKDVNPKQFLTCDKLWDRVQSSEKVQSGAADMDDLCSQLKAKAKCSGSGAVIKQKDVDNILGPAPADQQDFLKMFS